MQLDRRWLHLGFAALLLLVCHQRIVATADEQPTADALRYITSALNLLDHGVLSMAEHRPDIEPAPGLLMGGPVTSLELALAAALDGDLRQTFECALTQRADCVVHLSTLRWLHFLETILTLALIWLLGLRILGRPLQAWLACLLALACRDLFLYTGLALAEPLHLLLSVSTLYLLVRSADPDGRFRHALLLGLCLGAGALTRPAVLIWLPLAGALLLMVWIHRYRERSRPDWHALVRVVVAASLATAVVASWVIRNWVVSQTATLSDPTYLDLALAHRAGYNAMDYHEWLVGWIYYLPDFGDSLAADLFPPESYRRLGWGDEGLYVHGRDTLAAIASSRPEGLSPREYLLQRHVLDDPVKHLLVSLLLAWRGAFIGQYWGLLAWLLVPLAWRWLPPTSRLPFLLVLTPPLALLLAQSMISVSLGRYNISLIAPLVLVLTVTFSGLVERLRVGLLGTRPSERTDS